MPKESISFDIDKSGGIIIQNRHLLVARAKGKVYFMAPGGKIESAETAEQALIRELREEFQIEVLIQDLEPFNSFEALSAGDSTKTIRMDVFIVNQWKGTITPASEIEEIAWIDSRNELPLGSIFAHNVLPKLKQLNLIK